MQVFFFFSNSGFNTSFSSLIAMARLSKAMLNDNRESVHHCLLPDLRGNAFNVSQLRKMFAVSFSYMAFIVLRLVPSMTTFWKVFVNGCWILSNLFLHILRWSYGFYSLICSHGVSHQLICGYWKILTFLG